MTSREPLSKEQDIQDPKEFWDMQVYSGAVTVVLMMLRHLYEAPQALRWLTSAQELLGMKVPADMLVTIEGRREVEALIARINDGAFS